MNSDKSYSKDLKRGKRSIKGAKKEQDPKNVKGEDLI